MRALTAMAMVNVPRGETQRLYEGVEHETYAKELVRRLTLLIYGDKPEHMASPTHDHRIDVEWDRHVRFQYNEDVLKVNVPLNLDRLNDEDYVLSRQEAAYQAALDAINERFPDAPAD